MKNDVKNTPVPKLPLIYRMTQVIARGLGLKVFTQSEKTPIKFRGQALMPPTQHDKETLAAAVQKRAMRASKKALTLPRSGEI